MTFTAEELAEMAAYDAEVDASEATPEELAAVDARNEAIMVERIGEKERERRKKSRAVNKDKRRAYDKQYQAANRERIAARRREYYLAHREEALEYRRQYDAKKKAVKG